MSQGWMRVREAAGLLSVSESTVRRRIAEGQLRGRSGKSGRQEVFVPAKLRRQAEPESASQDPEPVSDEVVLDTEPVLVNEEAAPPEDDMIQRYERLAGGSLVLAQKRADELHEAASAAYENLAHARDQLRQVRKVALVGWGVGAAAFALALIVSLAFGISNAKTQALAEASRDAADQANAEVESLRDELAQAEAAMAVSHALESHASVPTD